MKKTAYDILMGIIPVMIGVYLGIFFNNQNEEKKQDELRNQIFESLLVENQSNLESLQESVAYFAMLKDSSSYILSNDLPYKQFSFWKGLNPPELSNTAFQTAQVTNILPGISIGMLQALSKTYDGQDDLQDLGNAYFLSVTNKIGSNNFDNTKFLIILENYSFDMMVAEQALVKEIENLIELLKGQSSN
ncbi:hypothetical protein [Ekhidna sp. To15]|uniref:hypothetical protein n=1 Tax=Ekhidna sp. To15 TaxID=3395267 RepID=UPI003F51FE1E